jgi:hypothetical protein
VKIVDGRATHEQEKDRYSVKKAFDGNVETGKEGWAIGGGTGKRQEATFQFAKPIAEEKGSTLTINMIQGFRQGFIIGRFRLWVTTAPAKQSLEFGLPAPLIAALKTPLDQRTAEQTKLIAEHRKLTDAEYIRRTTALWNARKPLPIDPTLVAKQTTIKELSVPTPLDPRLVQLRKDVQASEQQLANSRLTGAQDVTWALINSPAFLFNH